MAQVHITEEELAKDLHGVLRIPKNSTAVMDAGFARDVEAAIDSHREPLEPPQWD